VELLQPDTLAEALAAKRAYPDAVPIMGGTDVMVDLNFGRLRPETILDLGRIRELDDWSDDGDQLRIGAGVSYARIIAELAERLPALAIAARTVGSPQIRNRGTVGGNLATSSPAGDGLPPLYASGAEIELASTHGTRRVPVAQFITGPKRNSLAPTELIVSFSMPPADGPQQYAKVGSRNAMVIAVASLALAVHTRQRRVGVCIGSAGPTPLRAGDAERFIEGALDETGLWNSPATLDRGIVRRFGELVQQEARPIDDVRGTAAYRRHAIGILASRALDWAWDEYCTAAGCA
jgi:CO/xanthine dehydrogenase FAD-binding subunit